MRHSIRTHLLILVITVMMAGFIAIVLSSGSLFQIHYRQALQQNALVIGKTLAQQAERLLKLGIPLSELAGFDLLCQETVNNYDNVAYAMVVSMDGTPLYSSSSGDVTPDPVIKQNSSLIAAGEERIGRSQHAGEHYLDALVPVRQLNGEQAGVVVIGIPATVINSKLGLLINISILIATGTLLLMLLLVVLALNRLLFRPLHQLLNAIRRIHGERQDLSQRVAVTTQNEMGELGNAFNQLLSDLARSQQKIHGHTQILEQRVEERTAELQRSLEYLHDSNERLAGIAESSMDAVIMTDDRGVVVFWNRSAERITGYSSDEALGRKLLRLVASTREMENYRNGFRHFASVGQGPMIGTIREMQVRRKNGEEFPAEISVASVRIKNHWHAVGILRDITERKLLEAELEDLAIHDALTGLYNRGELGRRLGDEVRRARRYRRPLSLFMLDIDWFKKINDSYGHKAGDEILRSLAELLMVEVRTQDYVARYGGEEFVIILPETIPKKALELARRLCDEVAATRFCLEARKDLNVTVSIGVAGYPDNGDSSEGLLEAADMAMYAAKKAGRNRVRLARGKQ